ncbi:hypothetical protein F4678DRAFT_440236 [Xylaria arbuscula]|nr:hypothetical protein F4678DRAFT_440236 [Xylaria arbuscula]
MANQPGNWREQYGQPYRKRKNLECHSGHRHATNTPAAGLVLVRLNADSQMELLLDLRSMAVACGGTFGFIGGLASTIGEASLATAMREAQEEYNIDSNEIKPTGHTLRKDHGGHKYLYYTYVFAEYNPKDGQAPAPASGESIRSEWFPLESLPDNLIKFIVEDLQQIKDILYADVLPKLRREQNMQQKAISSLEIPVDEDGDVVMGEAPPVQNAANDTPTSNPANMGKTGEVHYPELPNVLPGNNGNSKPPADSPSNPTMPSNGQVQYPTLPTADGSNGSTSAMPGPKGPSGQVRYPALPTPPHSSKQEEDKAKTGDKKTKTEDKKATPPSSQDKAKTEEKKTKTKDKKATPDKPTQTPRGSIFANLFRSPFKTPSKPSTTPANKKQKDQGKVQQNVQSQAKQDDQSKTKQIEQNKATQKPQSKVKQNGQNKAKENDQSKAKQTNQGKAKAQEKDQGKETKQKDQVKQGVAASLSSFIPAVMKPAGPEPKPDGSGLLIPGPRILPSAGFIPGTFEHHSVSKLMQLPSSLSQVPPPFVPPPSKPQSNPTPAPATGPSNQNMQPTSSLPRTRRNEPPVSLGSTPTSPSNKRKDLHEPMPGASATLNKRSQLGQPASNNNGKPMARKAFTPSQMDSKGPQYATNGSRTPNPPVVGVNHDWNTPRRDFGFF